MNPELEAMAKLSGWQPDHLAGWRIGDEAEIPTLGTVRVSALKPPSEILVEMQSGATVRVGWKALQRVETNQEEPADQ